MSVQRIMAMEAYREALEKYNNAKTEVDDLKERISDIESILIKKISAAVNNIENNFQEFSDDEKTDDGDVNLSGRLFLSLFKDDVYNRFSLIDRFNEKADLHNQYLDRAKSIERRLETIKLMESNGHSSKFDNSKLLDLTPEISGHSAEGKQAARRKLLAFLQENKEDVPSFVQDYVSAWLSET